MASKLVKLRKSRQTIVDYMKRLVKEQVMPIYDNCDENGIALLYSQKKVLIKKLEKFVSISEEISGLIEDENELQIDVNESGDFEIEMENHLVVMERFIRKTEKIEKTSMSSEKTFEKQ